MVLNVNECDHPASEQDGRHCGACGADMVDRANLAQLERLREYEALAPLADLRSWVSSVRSRGELVSRTPNLDAVEPERRHWYRLRDAVLKLSPGTPKSEG